MIDPAQNHFLGMKRTAAYIAKEATSRGWSVRIPYAGSSFLFMTRTDGIHIRTFSAVPDTTSYISASMTEDKYMAHTILRQHGFPVLGTVRVDDTPTDEAEKMLGSGVVVKPIDAAHGYGITTHVYTVDQLSHAIDSAKAHNTHSTGAIVQKMYVDPTDLRLLCIDNTFSAATLRLPAAVTGDGIHTVKELIEIENATFRGVAYEARLARINVASSEQFLGDKMRQIPENGERVIVSGTANYGAGGEVVDATDDIPQWMIGIAEDAAALFGLPVCGVDFLVRRSPVKDSSQADLEPYITELNKCPSFIIHEEPTSGKRRPVTKILVDYLSRI